MAFLSAGVLFERNDLEAVIDANADVLSPIVHDLAALGAPSPNENGTQFNASRSCGQATPFFSSSRVRSLSLSGTPFVTAALARGLRSELVERLARASMAAATATIERMNWSVQHEYPAAAAPMVSLVGGFDADKAFDIAVVYGGLQNYSLNDVEGAWDLMRWEEALSYHLRAVEESLMYGAGERAERDPAHGRHCGMRSPLRTWDQRKRRRNAAATDVT